jgi:oligoribonuclease NrnB/cAMP/cGMP phosphodiesterase (DHH superfamily)
MNIAIIYHDADFDGKLSNEVCRFWLKKMYPDATIHSYGWNYGRPVPTTFENPDVPGMSMGYADYDSIYIVDLSVDELMARPELRDKIVWIDHHKSAIEKWVNQSPNQYGFQFTGYRIDGVAACRLCWQWFYIQQLDAQDGGEGRFTLPFKQHYIGRAVDEPALLSLAGEYDIWDHRDPDAKALQFGLRTLLPHEFEMLIDEQFKGPFESSSTSFLTQTINHGDLIKSYCDKQNDEYSAAYSHTIKWEGLTFCALNIGQRGNSDLLRGGIKPEHEALFAWRWDGKSVMVSLYHAPGQEHRDLSVIATKYGGGGHRGACGFRISLTQLNDILTQK